MINLWFVLLAAWLPCAWVAARMAGDHFKRREAMHRNPSALHPFRASCGHLLHSPTGDLLDMEHVEFFHLRLCLAADREDAA